jgi:hypothetical protein
MAVRPVPGYTWMLVALVIKDRSGDNPVDLSGTLRFGVREKGTDSIRRLGPSLVVKTEHPCRQALTSDQGRRQSSERRSLSGERS